MPRRSVAVPPDDLPARQCAVAAALWRYTDAPLFKGTYVRGCVPDLEEPRVTVVLWGGPGARAGFNLFLSLPLNIGGSPVSPGQVVAGLGRLARATHLFPMSPHRFAGRVLIEARSLLVDLPAPPPPTGAATVRPEAPRGFYFVRPGQLRTY
ncbi:hypothetical protein [Streptomyces sp. NPDC060194]|uniref:hypothetical protein n=1 Tax=Streptomyces sp. NPDC060194 TaxID=3347069 RepID=UPI0036664689